MYTIFEDGENTVSSQLIKSIYSEEERTSMIFAGGAPNIPSVIESLDTDDIICAIVDVVPDNLSTVQRINDFYKRYSSVYFIPVICMEYFILQRFCRDILDSEMLSVLDSKLYRDSILYKDILRSSTKYTLERFYKKMLSLKTLDCMRNVSIESKDYKRGFGRFYMADCICDRSKSNCCTPLSRDNKAIELLFSLPTFSPIKRAEGLYSMYSVKEIQKAALYSYYSVARKFLTAGYIHDISDIKIGL